MSEATLADKTRVLSGFALKRIAVISMVFDHLSSIVMDGVLAPYRVDGLIFFTEDMPWYIRFSPLIKQIFSTIGYIAFPIFCFLVSEGFIHTKNKLKYGLRMLLFALVSEIPYDLAHYGEFFNFSLQNVMFTLSVGIFTLVLIELIQSKFGDKTVTGIALTVAAIVAGAAVAFLIRGEYVFLGVASISLFYLFRNNRYLRLLGGLPLVAVSPWTLVALVPISLYSGKLGKGSKYFFYLFYPLHFLLFAGISYLLANR